MLGLVVFHSPGELQVSAMVYGSWDRPPLELVIESGAHAGFGNDPHSVCAQFIGWLYSQSPVPGIFHVLSLPGLPLSGEDFDQWDWYDRMMIELAANKNPPFLVDLDDSLISQGGEVLWPPPERRRKRRTDRRSQPPGALFPMGWYGQELGEFRTGDSTYNCYPPEELPPIRSRLDGSFGWLVEAPEHTRSVAPNAEETTAILNQLLTANSTGLPQDFIAFFRSPSLWRRIRSCTDCYLNLDSISVGIRDGSGSLLRFLSDSQGCKHWHLYISPCGKRHSVVATYRFTGSEETHLGNGLPHRKDITTCAESFEEFMYRFWLENEIWFALCFDGKIPDGGEEYLGFYRSKLQNT